VASKTSKSVGTHLFRINTSANAEIFYTEEVGGEKKTLIEKGGMSQKSLTYIGV